VKKAANWPGRCEAAGFRAAGVVPAGWETAEVTAVKAATVAAEEDAERSIGRRFPVHTSPRIVA